jgi:glycosyltransferase involved in cell wall biosynthesis
MLNVNLFLRLKETKTYLCDFKTAFKMISITIPTHNRAHLISRAIQSILDQTYTDWELFVVDDGSTDDTGEVMSKFTQDPRINYHKKKKEGATIARNKGVEMASGEFITFLDSDDEAAPNWLESYDKIIQDNNAQVISCGKATYDHNGEKISETFPKELKDLFPDIKSQFTNGGTYILKRSIFNTIGGFDPKSSSGQHTEMGFRLVPYCQEQGIKIYSTNKLLIKVHIHKGARIRTDKKAKYKGAKYNFNKHAELYAKSPKARSSIEGVIAYNASQTGLKKEAFRYSLRSFKSEPNLKRFLRILYFPLK